MTTSKFHPKGFSLVEMAVVLVIVGFLLGGLTVPLLAQFDIQAFKKTNASLDEIKEALIGYAIINGRLPCPASAISNGVESFAPGGSDLNGNCSNFNNGLLPAATLGITPTDSNGYAIDGWSANTSNRIRYAVTQSNSKAFTTKNGMSATGVGALTPDLNVCASGTGITATTCSAGVATLTSTAVAVIFSLGKDAGTGGTSTDEAPNVDNNITFVSHDITPTFDDQMTWISYPVLANRLVAAGKLP